MICSVQIFRVLSQPVLRYLRELIRREDPPVVEEVGKQCLGIQSVCTAETKYKGCSAAMQTQGMPVGWNLLARLHPCFRKGLEEQEKVLWNATGRFVVWNRFCGRRGWNGEGSLPSKCSHRRGDTIATCKILGIVEDASKNYEYVLLTPEFGTFGPSLVVVIRSRILGAYSLWSDPTRCCSRFTVGLGSRGRRVSLSGYRERDGTKSNSQKCCIMTQPQREVWCAGLYG